MVRMTDLLKERFQDVLDLTHHSDNEWVNLSNGPLRSLVKRDEPVKQNLFDLVTLAYKTQVNAPNANLESPNDVLGNTYDYWEAISFDDTLEANATIFGRKLHGIQLCGIGHDGKEFSISSVIDKVIELLNTGKYWMESSPPLSKTLIDSGLIPFRNTNKIKHMFPASKEWEFNTDGSYTRNLELGKKTKLEYIFGNPK